MYHVLLFGSEDLLLLMVNIHFPWHRLMEWSSCSLLSDFRWWRVSADCSSTPQTTFCLSDMSFLQTVLNFFFHPSWLVALYCMYCMINTTFYKLRCIKHDPYLHVLLHCFVIFLQRPLVTFTRSNSNMFAFGKVKYESTNSVSEKFTSDMQQVHCSRTFSLFICFYKMRAEE